jgi:hypothetical protein
VAQLFSLGIVRMVVIIMIILHYIANLFAGLFLCNCVPHLACGLSGEGFPTPFAKPPGVGFSSALTNFLWGFSNLVAGLVLLSLSDITVGFNLGCILFLGGVLLMGVFSSRRFEAVKAGKKDRNGSSHQKQ